MAYNGIHKCFFLLKYPEKNKLSQNRLHSSPLYSCKDQIHPLFTDKPCVPVVISPSRCLQYQRDVVQSGLIDNVSESRDSYVTFTNVFMTIEIAA